MTFSQVTNVRDAVLALSTSHTSRLHGVAHWERVGQNGLALAAETDGADAEVVLLFALFHGKSLRVSSRRLLN